VYVDKTLYLFSFLRKKLSRRAVLSFALMFTLSTFRCLYQHLIIYYLIWRNSSSRAPSFTRFLDQTQRRTIAGRTPLYEGSARHRPLPDNTQQSQQTDIHASCGIRTRNPSKRGAADLRLRPRGHSDRLHQLINIKVLNLCRP